MSKIRGNFINDTFTPDENGDFIKLVGEDGSSIILKEWKGLINSLKSNEVNIGVKPIIPTSKKTIITLKDLPKVSLNKIYAGEHYTKRKKLKDTYKLLIKSQYKGVFLKTKKYSVEYRFGFRIRPLDVSNTVYMLKMIEDILFEDDTYKIVPELKIKSNKANEDYVEVIVTEL